VGTNASTPISMVGRRTEANREIIRDTLSVIIVEIEARLCEAGLDLPICLAVPNSGDAIITMATPLDPTEVDWSRAVEVVCRIVSECLGGLNLRRQDAICGMTKSSDVTPFLIQ